MTTPYPADAPRPSAAEPGASAQPASTWTAPVPEAPRRRGVRLSTVVWGMLIAVVGVGIAARGLGADFDNQLALIIVLCATGLALVLTSIYSAVRKR